MNTPIKASTQEHLDIYTIKDHIVFLKDGSAALVLQSTAINFNLLSEEEQDATIFAYAGLLNSLSFPLEIVIRSQRKNITDYLSLLDSQIKTTSSQKIRESIIKYRQFVKSLVKDNRVLEKHFYLVVPFSTVELGLTAKSFNPFKRTPQKPPFDLDYIIEKASMTLYPRRDHLIRQFGRLGLKLKQLTTPELIDLFHLIYNQNLSNHYVAGVTPQQLKEDLTTQKNPSKASNQAGKTPPSPQKPVTTPQPSTPVVPQSPPKPTIPPASPVTTPQPPLSTPSSLPIPPQTPLTPPSPPLNPPISPPPSSPNPPASTTQSVSEIVNRPPVTTPKTIFTRQT
jgi:hypothetical protein